MSDCFKPKLIAFDIDGTVLNEKGELPPRTGAALQRAMSAGIKVICATGRMFPSALHIIRQIGVTDSSVFLNGAQIKNPVTNETVYERELNRELTRRILAFYRENGWYAQIYHGDRLFVEDDTDERCKHYERVSNVKAVALGSDFWNFEGTSAKMLGIEFDIEAYKKMCDGTAAEFAGEIYAAPSQGCFIEIVHAEVNKARSLAFAAERLGVSQKDTLAFGDGENDREMLKWAGLGAAMGNASDRVKKCADIIAPDNNSDGVAVIIENFLDKGTF